MQLKRLNDVLMLDIGDDLCVPFFEEWVKQLRPLPYEEFGDFMRDTIYPALSDKERKLWHKATISNRDLQNAIQAF